MRRTASPAIALVAAALVAAAACSDGSVAAPDTSVADSAFVGTFRLKTVDGQALPFLALQTESTSVYISSASLVMGNDHSWTQAVVFETVEGPQTIASEGGDNGTWAHSGTALNLYSTKNAKTAYLGSLDSAALDLVSDGALFVFAR